MQSIFYVTPRFAGIVEDPALRRVSDFSSVMLPAIIEHGKLLFPDEHLEVEVVHRGKGPIRIVPKAKAWKPGSKLRCKSPDKVVVVLPEELLHFFRWVGNEKGVKVRERKLVVERRQHGH